MAPYRTPAVREQDDFLFHLYRATDLLKQNRSTEAKQEIELALEYAPADARSQDLLARTYYRMGMYPHAVEIFEKLLKRYPSELNLRLNLSLSFLRSKQPALALPHLHHFLTHHPQHERALCLLGLAYWNLGRPEEATHLFEQAGRREWLTHLSPHPLARNLPHATLVGGSEAVLARLDIRSEPPTIQTKSSIPSVASDSGDLPSRSGIRNISVKRSATGPLEQWKVNIHQLDQMSIDEDGQLLIPCKEGIALRLGRLKLAFGNFDSTPLPRIVHGHPVADTVGGNKALVRVQENAFIVLEKPTNKSYFCIDLNQEKLCIKESALIAFTTSLNYHNSRLPTEEDNHVIHLSGRGQVVIALPAMPKVFPVRSNQGVYLSPRTVLGWSGTLLPVLDSSIQAKNPKDYSGIKLCLRGEGSLLTTAM